MDYLGFYSCLLTTLVFEYCFILTLSAIQIFFTDRQTIILIEVPPAFKNALLISHLIWITVLAKPNVPKKGLSIWKFIYRMALAFSRPWSFWGWDLSSTSTISAVSPPAAGAIWATAPLPLAVGARWATSGSWSLMLLSGLVDIKSEIYNFRKGEFVEVVGRSLFWDIVKICNLG